MEYRPTYQMRYTPEVLSEHWDDPYYRIFSLKRDEEGCYYYLTSNPTNDSYFSTPIQIGVKIEVYMCKDDSERVNFYANRWYRKSGISNFAILSEDEKLWNTTVETIGDTLFAVSKLDDNNFAPAPPNFDLQHLNYYKKRDIKFWVIVINANKGYILENIFSNFLPLERCNQYNGHNVSVLFENNTNIQSLAVLEKSINENSVISFYDKYPLDGVDLNYKVNLFPLKDTGKIIMLSVLGKYDDIFVENNELDPVVNSSLFAVCIVKVEAEKYGIVKTNKVFDDLYTQGKIIFDANYCSDSFYTSVEKKIQVFAIHTRVIGDKKYQYYINFNPYIHEGTVTSVTCVISMTELDAKLESLKEKLTAREEEIILMIVDGLTNKEISRALGITEGTVKRIVYNSYKKLNINSRKELCKIFNLN